MRRERRISTSGALIALISLAAIATGQEQSLNVISAKARVGDVVTVCGHVTEYGCARPHTTLTLAPALDPLPFNIQIVDDDRAKFGFRVEERFLNRIVCVTGEVEKLARTYQVSVTDPTLVALVNDERAQPLAPFAPNAYSACDPGVVLPKVRREVKPNYTREATARTIAGVVMMRGVVKVDGSVGEMQVLRPLEPGLDQEALRAFGQWRFEPGTYLGKTAPVVVIMEMTFMMKK